MKKITIVLMFVFGFLVSGFAQRDSATTSSKSVTQVKTVKHSTGVNKNGAPDMRLKVNKQAKAQTQVQTQNNAQTTTQTSQTKMQTSGVTIAKNNDQAVGTDAKGRTIYQGKRGGKYVITKNGNKEYLPKN